MNENVKQILKSDLSNKEKVNKLIQFDTEMHTTLGLESTAKERLNVKQVSDFIIDEVVKLDPELEYLQTSRYFGGINWNELRENFFNECTTPTPKEIIEKKVNIAPHDLFEWFKNEILEYLQTAKDK